jgi:hypothetical protein
MEDNPTTVRQGELPLYEDPRVCVAWDERAEPVRNFGTQPSATPTAVAHSERSRSDEILVERSCHEATSDGPARKTTRTLRAPTKSAGPRDELKRTPAASRAFSRRSFI